jgi:UPF0716 protein FxsA
VLAKSQGLRVLHAIQADLRAGRVPTGRLMDGLLVLVGGIVLLTPGLLTDVLGIVLLLPFTRARFMAGVRRRFERLVSAGEVNVITLVR